MRGNAPLLPAALRQAGDRPGGGTVPARGETPPHPREGLNRFRLCPPAEHSPALTHRSGDAQRPPPSKPETSTPLRSAAPAADRGPRWRTPTLRAPPRPGGRCRSVRADARGTGASRQAAGQNRAGRDGAGLEPTVQSGTERVAAAAGRQFHCLGTAGGGDRRCDAAV